MIGGEAAWQEAVQPELTREQQRELVIRGATKAGELIASAFGPRGGRIAIARPGAFQLVTRRAADALGGLSSAHPLEAEGVDAIRQIATDVESSVGLAAKTACLIAESLLSGGEAALAAGHSRSELIAGMSAAKAAAVSALRDSAAKPTDELTYAAMKTAALDEQIAGQVRRAAGLAGGVQYVSIESGGSNLIDVVPIEGHTIEGRVAHDRFLAGREGGELRLEDVHTLDTTEKVSSMRTLLPILEAVAQAGRPLVIFADAVEGEALATLLVNWERGSVQCVVVRASGMGASRFAVLEDVAALTGARFFHPEYGDDLTTATIKDLGRAGSISIVDGHVSFIDPGRDQARVNSRLTTLRLELTSADGIAEEAPLLRRYAALTGRGAWLVVGGETRNESLDSQWRATQAATAMLRAAQGVVPGGGVALLRCSEQVARIDLRSESENTGRDVFASSLRAPFARIAINAGVRPEDAFASLTSGGERAGVDGHSGGLVADMFDAGVVDVAIALERAVGLAFSRVRDLLETSAWTVGALRSATPHALSERSLGPRVRGQGDSPEVNYAR